MQQGTGAVEIKSGYWINSGWRIENVTRNQTFKRKLSNWY